MLTNQQIKALFDNNNAIIARNNAHCYRFNKRDNIWFIQDRKILQATTNIIDLIIAFNAIVLSGGTYEIVS